MFCSIMLIMLKVCYLNVNGIKSLMFSNLQLTFTKSEILIFYSKIQTLLILKLLMFNTTHLNFIGCILVLLNTIRLNFIGDIP